MEPISFFLKKGSFSYPLTPELKKVFQGEWIITKSAEDVLILLREDRWHSILLRIRDLRPKTEEKKKSKTSLIRNLISPSQPVNFDKPRLRIHKGLQIFGGIQGKDIIIRMVEEDKAIILPAD